MVTCIWCRKSHEATVRFRCYQCGETLCQKQIQEVPSLISQQLGVLAHANRSCGPVYDIINVSPVERIMWFMRKTDSRGILVENSRYVAKITNGKSKT